MGEMLMMVGVLEVLGFVVWLTGMYLMMFLKGVGEWRVEGFLNGRRARCVGAWSWDHVNTIFLDIHPVCVGRSIYSTSSSIRPPSFQLEPHH